MYPQLILTSRHQCIPLELNSINNSDKNLFSSILKRMGNFFSHPDLVRKIEEKKGMYF